LQDRIVLNYTRLESAHKVRTQENYQFFVMYRSPVKKGIGDCLSFSLRTAVLSYMKTTCCVS